MAQAQKARLTNISDSHIGFSRPTGVFLRRRQHKPDHLRWAVVDADQVNEKMKELEAEGKIRIDFLDANGNIITPETEEHDIVQIDGDGDVVKVGNEETKETTKPESAEAKVEVTEKIEPPEDEVIPALVEPPKKENIPTVGSDEDGRPQIQNAEQDDPPSESAEDDEETKDVEQEPEPETPDEGEKENPEEASSTEYTREDLKKMNLRQVREILEKREIDIDSAHKDVLIEAILDRQIMAGA